MRAIGIVTVLVSIVASCTMNTKNHIKENNKEITELYGLMQGSFNSEKQSLEDSAYFNISLHMYPIWVGSANFLYVEQAVSSMPDKPYRQRIYQLEKTSDSTITSYIYKIPNDSLWVGAWKDTSAFNNLSKEQLQKLDGCEVVLKRLGEKHYKGSTGEQTCASNLYGASYAQSEVEITSDVVFSWDRGFDEQGEQIWGAVKGGYIFNKLH